MHKKALLQNEELTISGIIETNSGSSDEEINNKYIKGDVRIITEQARYPLNTILSMVEGESYILNPEFQRRHRWMPPRKSKLIESFIMNVPIPPIFLYEKSYSVYEVMDGLQRLTAISQFYKDEFALEGLEEWPELNGKLYSQLPDQVRKGIDRRYLSSIILLQETAKSNEEANRLKQLVFERINSGGEKLEPQETRNALFPGKLNSLCITLARTPSFCAMWDIPAPTIEEITNNILSDDLVQNELFKKMEDVELVLRVFAYRQIEKWKTPKLSFFLDNFLKKGNEFGDEIIEFYKKSFIETCDLAFEIFGEKAFWLWRPRQNSKDFVHFERPTKVLYDPLMYVLSELLSQKENLISNKDKINKATKKFHQQNYTIFAGRDTNRNNVIDRIEAFEKFFKDIIGQ